MTANADSANDVGERRHLPECPVPDMNRVHPLHPEDAEANCLCSTLRACEQRVRLEDDDYAYVAAQAEADGRRRGWVEALEAAREAVAASSDHYDLCICDECCGTEAALAAIDALRGSGNPHTPPSAEKGEQA